MPFTRFLTTRSHLLVAVKDSIDFRVVLHPNQTFGAWLIIPRRLSLPHSLRGRSSLIRKLSAWACCFAELVNYYCEVCWWYQRGIASVNDMQHLICPLLHHRILPISLRSGPTFASQIKADLFDLDLHLHLLLNPAQNHHHFHILLLPPLGHLTLRQKHQPRHQPTLASLQPTLVTQQLQTTPQRLLTEQMNFYLLPSFLDSPSATRYSHR